MEPIPDHEASCAALYAKGNKTYPVPSGLVVVGRSDCMLCKNSMRNNRYPESVNGVPVTWLNVNEQIGIDILYSIPGITYENGVAHAVGKELGGVPFVLLVEEGAVKRDALKYGEIAVDGLAQLLESVR